MEGASQLEVCLPSLYALDPYTAPPPLLAPLPNQQKLIQMPLVHGQSGNHGVLFSSDHGGGLYPLLPGIPFVHSIPAAPVCEKSTGFASLGGAGEVIYLR
jgi:hypothetical protein